MRCAEDTCLKADWLKSGNSIIAATKIIRPEKSGFVFRFFLVSWKISLDYLVGYKRSLAVRTSQLNSRVCTENIFRKLIFRTDIGKGYFKGIHIYAIFDWAKFCTNAGPNWMWHSFKISKIPKSVSPLNVDKVRGNQLSDQATGGNMENHWEIKVLSS